MQIAYSAKIRDPPYGGIAESFVRLARSVSSNSRGIQWNLALSQRHLPTAREGHVFFENSVAGLLERV